MTIQVGVIGTGIMGAGHVNTLRRYVASGEVGKVADTDPARARAVADTCRV